MLLDNLLCETIHDYGLIFEGWYAPKPSGKPPTEDEIALFPFRPLYSDLPLRILKWLEMQVLISTDGRDHNVYDNSGGRMWCKEHDHLYDLPFCRVDHRTSNRNYKTKMLIGWFPLSASFKPGWVGTKEVLTYLNETYPEFFVYGDLTNRNYNRQSTMYRLRRYFNDSVAATDDTGLIARFLWFRILYGYEYPSPPNTDNGVVRDTLSWLHSNTGGIVCEVCSGRESDTYQIDTAPYVRKALDEFRVVLDLDNDLPVVEPVRSAFWVEGECNCDGCLSFRETMLSEEYDEYATS